VQGVRGLAIVLWAISACGGEAPAVQAPTEPSRASAAAPEDPAFPGEDQPLKRFHSVRFKLWLPLPDGPAWRIDDHARPELVATHAATSSKLTLMTTIEPELMNRRKCEERARAAGFVPEPGGGSQNFRTVEDQAIVGPDAYDTRIWVMLQPGGKPGTSLRGHVFAFGAYIRKCLLVHFESEVSSDKLEDVLSERLATARLRIVGGIALEPFDEPPRAKRPGDLGVSPNGSGN
jgi:hypothetical protein